MRRPIPLALKIAHTAFVVVLVPVYWQHFGPGNFLWFSDIALLALVPALWLESRLLVSMQAVSVLLLEAAWIAEFMMQLAGAGRVIGLAEYMFNPELPWWLRMLSLFHVGMPLLLIWLLYRLGYDRRALKYQTMAGWLVLLASYLFTQPNDNVNWVYGIPGDAGAEFFDAPDGLFAAFLCVLFPLAIYLPTHLWLLWSFPSSRGR